MICILFVVFLVWFSFLVIGLLPVEGLLVFAIVILVS